jgi:hypothetical protein
MDFIGRVVPGATILLAARMVADGNWNALSTVLAKDGDGINWAVLLPGLLACYIIGVSMSQLWYLTLRRFTVKRHTRDERKCKERCLKEHNQLLKSLGREGFTFAHGALPRGYVMHDHLRITLPHEASRLLKLQSESRLCRSLVMGLGLLCLVNLIFIFRHFSGERAIIEIIMIILVVTSWQRDFRLQEYYMNGTCVMWLALVSTNRLLEPLGAKSSKEHSNADNDE